MPSESPNKKQWGPERSDSPEVNNKIDSYKTSIRNHFYSNPDSAIYYYLKIIDLYRGQYMPYNIFDANVQVSELYLKKSDGANAVYYYGEALKIKNKNGGIEDYNPYFYINMGNMFYVNNLLPQAKSSYNKAIAIAAQMKNGFAMSVAQNNIGLVCQKEADYNSSCNFFKKSLELRKKDRANASKLIANQF